MEAKSAVSLESAAASYRKPIIVSKELESLIGTVQSVEKVTTLDEILQGLKVYICKKKLFDPFIPGRIVCKGDELGSVFGVTEFAICEVKGFLKKFVAPVDKNSFPEAVCAHTNSVTGSATKRTLEDSEDSQNKKICSVGEDISPHKHGGMLKQIYSPMVLHIPESPIRCYDVSDSAESIQGYETSYVKDSSDDVWSVDSNRPFFDERILAIEETFDVEYDVDFSSENDTETAEESDSDEEDALNTAIVHLLCRSDSDMEFWADGSSEEDCSVLDIEISESDQWKCSNCGSLNKPPMRYCLRCWDQRLGWLPEKRDEFQKRRAPKRRKHRSRKVNDETSVKEVDLSCSSQETATSLSQEVPVFENSETVQNTLEQDIMCIICCAKPAKASIIHGKFAHQIACYQCARKLQKQKKRCPICRRTIDRVVHQISTI